MGRLERSIGDQVERIWASGPVRVQGSGQLCEWIWGLGLFFAAALSPGDAPRGLGVTQGLGSGWSSSKTLTAAGRRCSRFPIASPLC